MQSEHQTLGELLARPISNEEIENVAGGGQHIAPTPICCINGICGVDEIGDC